MVASVVAPSTILSISGVRYSVSSFNKPAFARSWMVTGSNIAASGRSSVAPESAVIVIFSRISAVPLVCTNSILTSGAMSLWLSSQVSNHCCLYCGLPIAYTVTVPAGNTCFSPDASALVSSLFSSALVSSAAFVSAVPAVSLEPPPHAVSAPAAIIAATAITIALFFIYLPPFLILSLILLIMLLNEL